jgi:hypothetical protein
MPLEAFLMACLGGLIAGTPLVILTVTMFLTGRHK